MDLKSVMNSEWGKSHIVFGSVSSAGIDASRSESATVMTEEEYLAKRGLSSPVSDYMIDKQKIPHGETESQRKLRIAEADRIAKEYAESRNQARAEYREKVKNGEIREPTEIEKLERAAAGNSDNESVKAAKRALEKRSAVSETKGQKLVKDIEQSIAELEKKIDSPETEKTIREWLSFQGQFHTYSLNNAYWLAVQSMMRRTHISQVAGFRKWIEMKGEDGQTVSVNKGEKGYSILYPQIHKYYEKDENGNFKKDENGEKIPLLDENGKPEERISYGVGYVFDVSQTNAVEIGAYKELNHRGEAVKIDPELVQEIAKRITAEYGIPVLFEENKVEQAGGWYMPSAHSITINTAVSKELSHQLGTLFHELGHGLMHGQNSANYSRSLKEGQAEAFAYACSMQFGVERKSELYIKSWIADEVPLQDVMKDISSNIKDAFEKLKLQELILKQQMQTDVSVPEKQNSENQTEKKQPVTEEQQSSEKVSENAVFMLNKVFLLGANTAFSQKSNPRYKELCKACDYIQQMEQSDPRIAELYSIVLEGERNNFSKERTGAEILNRVFEYQKLEKRQNEQKQDESQMMLF